MRVLYPVVFCSPTKDVGTTIEWPFPLNRLLVIPPVSLETSHSSPMIIVMTQCVILTSGRNGSTISAKEMVEWMLWDAPSGHPRRKELLRPISEVHLLW